MNIKTWQDVLLEIVETDPADFTDRKNICISPKDLGDILRAALQAEVDRVSKDAERYDYLLTKRLGWLSRLAPIPWGKQTQKEAMSAALDTAMKEPS